MGEESDADGGTTVSSEASSSEESEEEDVDERGNISSIESEVEPEVKSEIDPGAGSDAGGDAETADDGESETIGQGEPEAVAESDAAVEAETEAETGEEERAHGAPDVDLTPNPPIDEGEEVDPIQDQEMPLAEHIEEMVMRLAIVLAVVAIVTAVVFPFAEYAINFLWNSVLPAGETTRPRVYGPLALKLTEIKVASLAGFIAALPVFVYQTYQFMKPGLYPHERRYYLAAVPTSLVLAFVGVSFAYFLVLPAIFNYFLYYSQDVTIIAFGLTKTFDLILLLMGYLAVVFQIPLFVMLAIMMGLTTRQWMADRRLYFWGGFLGLSFLVSPDPTGMAPIMVAATMVALFEGTLFLLKWTGR